MHQLNLLGAWIAIIIFLLSILVFVSRLVGRARLGYWLGVPLLLTFLPLTYLLAAAPYQDRKPIYYLQISLMLLYLVVEALLDYVLKFDFRRVSWMAITYTIIFFAGTGGMIGVASLAGREWLIVAVALFWIMAVLAFVQRAKLGT
jgi:hypothetical protein